MDWSTLAALVIIAVAALSFSRLPALRTLSKTVFAVLFAGFALLALALLVGSIVLAGKGGGVLILFAIPAGFLAWFFRGLYRATAELRRFREMTPDEQMHYNKENVPKVRRDLEAMIAAKTRKLEHGRLTRDERARLIEAIERERAMLATLETAAGRIGDPALYRRTDEPSAR